MTKMLEFDPEKRISARDSFAHYYFDSYWDPNHEPEVIKSEFAFINYSDPHEDQTDESEADAEFDHSCHSSGLPVDVQTWKTIM